MARASRSLALSAVLAAAAVAVGTPVRAEGLRKLHLDVLTMRADRAQPRVGELFHLAIRAHVREPITALDELVVPDVGTMKLEGDERRVSSTLTGTDVVETLTLEPTQTGAFTFKGAYLDAIDARNGKPSRFSADAVRVVVGPATTIIRGPAAANVLQLVAWVVGAVLLGAAAITVVFAVALRSRPHTVPSGVRAVEVVPRPRTPYDEVAEALRAYRTVPANGALLHLRSALFAAAGVSSGATLRDALAATPDRTLHAALVAAERAAFGPEAARDAASAELIDATEGWLR